MHASCPRYKLWGYYNKLAAFISNAFSGLITSQNKRALKRLKQNNSF
ncbi:hypothetical protein [Helicobacter pylori]|nr:hypothetical protein [Helicobacter pylori]